MIGIAAPLTMTPPSRQTLAINPVLDVTTSSNEPYADIYQSWKDPRLAWNVDANKCITNIDATRASHDPEKTEIWTP